MRSIEIPQPDERSRRYRFFEILPGALTYLILALPVLLGLISVRLAAYFVLAYILIWFVRIIAINFRTLQGFRRMDQHRKLDWPALNDDLEKLEVHVPSAPAWHARNLVRVHERLLHVRLKPSEVIHAIVMPFYNETREIIEPSIQQILDSHYDPRKIILMLGYEERGGPASEKLAHDLIRDYGHRFYYAQAVKHPADILGEVIGKGGNLVTAGQRLKSFVEKEDIDPQRVIVTSLDCDHRPDKQYFAALTYLFCSTEEPKYTSYQPIAMFLNNIWDAPAPMRVIATGNSFWNMVLSLRPHALRNFAAHAQPLEALIETDFWSTRSIVEDGHQFWRTYFRFNGRHDVYPLYVPIYQDAVLAGSIRRTLKAQFYQLRRWAYGASDIAYVAEQGFFKPNHVPKRDLIAKFLRLLEGHVSWSTMPLILVGASFIPLFINPDSYTANQLPKIASQVNRIAMVGIVVALFVSLRSLPPKPARYKRHRTIWMVLQWAYLPFTTILYHSTAALNAQTRLMLGWYVGKFDVTEKAVKK